MKNKSVLLLAIFTFNFTLSITAAADSRDIKELQKKESEQVVEPSKEKSEEPVQEEKKSDNPFASFWESTRNIETSGYKLVIPTRWEKFPNMSKGVEYNYSLSGKGLPANYNGSSVLVSFYVTRQPASSLNNGVERVKALRGQGAKTVQLINKSENNWKGVLVESDYLQYLNGRDSKRYDLVVYSGKNSTAYVFSLVVLVKDPKQSFVDRYSIPQYADYIFKNIWMNE